MARVNIGTSGWNYAHWEKGVFYPSELKGEDYLSYFAQFFSTVELNTTFYHLPLPKTVEHWSERVPKDFLFSVKASRYITHLKRLLDPEEPLQGFFSRCDLLGEHLGPILFQLPATFKKDAMRLESFLQALDKHHRYVFEFRDPSWFSDEIYALLKHYKIALCLSDMKGAETPDILLTNWVYIRLHGPHGAYQGRYGSKRLKKWRDKIADWDPKETFIYFNNDARGNAIYDALELQELMVEDGSLF